MPHLSHAIILLDLLCFLENKIEAIWDLISLIRMKIMTGTIKGSNLNITIYCYIFSGLDLFKKFHDQDFLLEG